MYPSTLKKNLPHYLSLRFSGGVPTIKAPLIAPTDVPQSQYTSIFASWVPSFEGMFVEQAKPVRGPSSRPSSRGAIGGFRRKRYFAGLGRAGLALLFTPPFDRIAHDPGYIKAYPLARGPSCDATR